MPKLSGFPRVDIPGPRPAPLIGTMMRQIRFIDDPVGAVLGVRRYGEVAALVNRDPAFVCVFGEELNRRVLSDPETFRHDESFVGGRPGSPLAVLANALVAQNGEVHKRHRRLMQPAFKKSVLDDYADDIVAVTTSLVEDWPVSGTIDVAERCSEIAMAIAVKCFYGVDLGGRGAHLGPLTAEFLELQTSPAKILSPEVNLPGMPYRRALRLAEQLTRGLRELIDRKAEGASSGRDALSLLLAARDEEDGTGLTEDEIVGQAVSLFIAGHETSGVALAHVLFLLDRHPRWLSAVEREVAEVLGASPPTPGRLPDLPVLDRVVKESLRILAPVPVLFFRVVAESTTIGSFTVPKDANLVVSPLATHHDPAIYDEPLRFDPDRWRTIAPGPYAWLPFGAGPRQCIGRAFAEQSIRLVLPLIVQRRRVRATPSAVLRRLTRGNILHYRNGLPMTVGEPVGEPTAPAPVTGDFAELVDWAPPEAAR